MGVEDSALAVELGSGDDFWIWRDSIFVDELWIWRDSVFVDDL